MAENYYNNGYDPHNRTAAAVHISAYCALKAPTEGSDHCSYGDLQDAIRYNSACAGEAYQYCVAVTFPKEQAFDANGEQVGPDSASGGLSGASVCGVTLGISAVTSTVVTPMWKVLWNNIVFANPLMSIVIVGILLIWVVVTVKRK